ncbi:MAG TPA: PAS domain-containing protein [Chitinophagaceae bacterium]|nr:PAS domain-containing protein [Chitinophagaceae bacterium]
MVKNWKTLRKLIGNTESTGDLFLSLIGEDGQIQSANTHMQRKLDIANPRNTPINFFDLVHPIHVDEFRKTLTQACASQIANTVEVYIKNGQYHAMKWEVNCLEEEGAKKTYLCVGYELLDEQRWQQFNRLVQKHHQLILEGFSGIIFHDKNGELIAANHKTTDIFNTTLERLYQLRDIRQLWNEQWKITDVTGEKVMFDDTPFMMALKTGEPQKKTLVIRLLDGEERWVLFHSQVLKEEDADAQISVVSSIIDVTKERRLSVQLKERDALLDAFLQQTPHLAWVIDEDAILKFASVAFCKYFGICERTSIGKKVTDLVPEAVTEAVYKYHIEALETGDAVDTTQQVKLADGNTILYHINLFPIRTPTGKKLLGGQAVSLPDKSRLEKELRLTHERLLHFSRATSDAIWEWDMQTGQIFRNEALMAMIGYHLDNSKGLSWWLRRIHPDDRNRVGDKVKEATDNHAQSWQDQYRFKCADGNYKHIEDKGFVVYENGLPVRMIGSLQNVSERKELEGLLADERLERQKEISETIIRVQEKERSRIGHELHDNVNQILSTATLFVDMLKTKDKDQQQVKEKSIEYLKMAVEEIRKLSKELVTPHLKDEKLTDSIQRLVYDTELAGEIKISFVHDLETELLSPGKKLTLFRIVQEQLKNILTHSKAKGMNIFLQVKGDKVQLVIHDNGVGFDPGQTHQGIGLSSIHERAQFYNGTVEIQSAAGKGCRLEVSIPAFD